MSTRRTAVVCSIMAGAALVFAPLAAADELTATVDSEIATLNSIFEFEAFIAGDSADVVKNAGALDTIPLADAPDTGPLTTLDYELYGPFAGLDVGNLDPDPGAQDVFNGALVDFYAINAVEQTLLFDNYGAMPSSALLDLELTSVDDVLAELKADAAIQALAASLAWPQIALALLEGH
jgi:hypothetical protein